MNPETEPTTDNYPIETSIGTTIVNTRRRVYNPITEQSVTMENLSEDGYCRRYLALLSAANKPSVIDLGSSPHATFDKDKWELTESDGHYLLTKRDASTNFDELVLADNLNEEA